eukprot:gene7119-7923_t
MPPLEKKLKYVEGERVLCYHGPLIYEAVIKGQLKDKVTKYLIHYNGWNKNWDEWVAESRVLKYCDENLKKQKELKQQYATSKRAKKKALEAAAKAEEEKKESSGEPQTKRRRTRGGFSNDKEQSSATKLDVKITIPRDLRRFLLDDADFVTRQKQLVPLPKPKEKSVRAVLEDYIRVVDKKTNLTKGNATEEVIRGVSEYFDVVLGTQLLYKFERPQYSDLLKEYPNKPLCEIYGPEHLLRLFVKIGGMLSSANLDEKSMHFVVAQIQDFLEWMTKGADDMFTSEYEAATPEYYRRAAT